MAIAEIDRLDHHANIIDLMGENYRRKAAKKGLQEEKE